MESDEYFKAVAAKRRGLGLIQFVGELHLQDLLSEKIVHSCISKLCANDDPSEEVIESLCKLMTTVGKKLDSNPQTQPLMNTYFERMELFQNIPGLPSRLKFRLMDVADLRRARWVTKTKDAGPKTIAEIHEEARVKQAQEDAARERDRNRSRISRGPPLRSESSRSNLLAGDLSNFGRFGDRNSSPSLGPSSMLNRNLSGSNSSRKSSSPSLPLSKENSRAPSQTRVNMYEHLNDDGSSHERANEQDETADDLPSQE
jgi:translation initiation factor 4G